MKRTFEYIKIIAELTGWTDIQVNFDSDSGYIGQHPRAAGFNQWSYQGYKDGIARSDYGFEIPNFFESLDAMHFVEVNLHEDWYGYLMELRKTAVRRERGYSTAAEIEMDCVSASASKRAEAFLRMKGKWQGIK